MLANPADDQQAAVHAGRVAQVVDLNLQVAGRVLRVIAVDGHRGRVAGRDVAVVDDVAVDRAAAAERGAAVDGGRALVVEPLTDNRAGRDFGGAGVGIASAQHEGAGSLS